jgi:hypothetical protein
LASCFLLLYGDIQDFQLCHSWLGSKKKVNWHHYHCSSPTKSTICLWNVSVLLMLRSFFLRRNAEDQIFQFSDCLFVVLFDVKECSFLEVNERNVSGDSNWMEDKFMCLLSHHWVGAQFCCKYICWKILYSLFYTTKLRKV